MAQFSIHENKVISLQLLAQQNFLLDTITQQHLSAFLTIISSFNPNNISSENLLYLHTGTNIISDITRCLLNTNEDFGQFKRIYPDQNNESNNSGNFLNEPTMKIPRHILPIIKDNGSSKPNILQIIRNTPKDNMHTRNQSENSNTFS